MRILRERARLEVGGVELDRRLITHRSNRNLAKSTLYTERRMPRETADEVARLIGA